MKTSTSFLLVMFIYAMGSAQTFNCGDTLLDTRDGKKYATILIGTTCWMKQNLNYGQMVNSVNTGTPHTDVGNNAIVEKYCFGNISSNCNVYGGLYDWNEMMNYTTAEGGQGICPAGWHIPSMAEFSVLCNSSQVGGNALKTLGEGMGQGVGTNTSGWSGKLGGDRGSPGVFTGTANVGIYWSSTQTSSLQAGHLYLLGMNDSIKYWATEKMTGFSCRCVKNNATGLGEKINLRKPSVYPNPASNFISVRTESATESELFIFNLLGEKVHEERFSSSTFIETVAWKKGVYFYKLENAGIIFNGKVIVE